MILTADNINPMNPAVIRAMETLDPGPIRDIARRCEQKGVEYIDINPGYLTKKKEDRMTFLVETVQEAVNLKLILDSPHARILEAGLKACSEKPILNAITKEENKLKEILPLAAEKASGLVILLLDEKSICQPDVEGKISLAIELIEIAAAQNIDHEKLIIDPVMPNISWPNAFEQLGECVKTVQMLSSGTVLGKPVKTMMGISNFLSGQDKSGQEEFEKTCLPLLAGAGLDIALAGVLKQGIMNAFSLISKII